MDVCGKVVVENGLSARDSVLECRGTSMYESLSHEQDSIADVCPSALLSHPVHLSSAEVGSMLGARGSAIVEVFLLSRQTNAQKTLEQTKRH
jgi:hypothetical protein